MSAATDWNVREFFSEQLDSHGLDATVVEETGPATGIHFRVYKKSTDGETIFSTTVNIPTATIEFGEESLKSHLIQNAETVVRRFEHQTTRVLEWGKRHAEVSTYNGGWARCRKCNTRIEAPRVRYIRQSGKETSVAHPVSHQIGHERNNMSEYQLRLFELYLLGQLNGSCNCYL